MTVVPLSLQISYEVKKTEIIFLASGIHLGCVSDATFLLLKHREKTWKRMRLSRYKRS